MKAYKELFPLSVGIFLSLICVIALAKMFQGLNFGFLDETAEWAPHLIIAVVSGLGCIPMTLKHIDIIGKQ